MSIKDNGREMVVMHNNLVRHVIQRMSSLSVNDQKVVSYLIARGIKYHRDDDMPIEVEGSVAELAEIMDYKGHGIYERVRDATRSLMNHEISFRDLDGAQVYCPWLAWGKYYEKQGRFLVEFPAPLRPMLAAIRKHRTEMELETLLGLGGGCYAIRLYQLCKSWESQRGWIAALDILRDQLGVPEGAYQRLSDLRRMVLDYPIRTINQKSDIRVSYTKHNRGRKWTHVAFHVAPQSRKEKKAERPTGFHALSDGEKSEMWKWLRTTSRGEDLPEPENWSLVASSIGLDVAYRYWRESDWRESAQGELFS